MKRKRLLFVFISALFFLSLIFSVNFVTSQTRHEHLCEENCAICVELQSCNELLHTPSAGTIDPETAGFCPIFRNPREGRALDTRRERRTTPVSLKVKLIN